MRCALCRQMDKQIYNNLPQSLRHLVDEIEAHVGFEIQLQPKGDRQNVSELHETDEEFVGVMPRYDRATIEYQRSVDEISDEIYAHELLHLHRYYVRNIPHLYPKKKADGPSTAGMENWLEHVVIYGEQLKLVPTMATKFNADLEGFWDKCPWGLSGYALRFNLITRYLITNQYCSSTTKKAMGRAIKELTLPFSLRAAAKTAKSAIRDKRDFVVSVFGFCEIPVDKFWLREYDTKNRRNVWYDI